MSLLFAKTERGASGKKVTFLMRWMAWWTHVIRQLLSSIGEIWRTPVSSAMTIAVMGLSLTLPATLHIIVKNVQSINLDWDSASEITLFLRDGLTDQQIATATRRLSTYPEIDSIRYISKQDALREFQQESGFGQALQYLDDNPLPASLVVMPVSNHRSAEAAKTLLNKLQAEREIEFGKLDIDWLARLNAILGMLQESVITVAIILLLSVVLIIGNTIRLSIISKREEIEVMKLVGATESFIQRPFVFTGVWYGLLGGLVAYLILSLVVWWLQTALNDISGLYVAQFIIEGLTLNEFLTLIVVASGLGFSGAFWSVHRYIKEIEPDLD